jgi:hypothetical protein
MDWADPGEWKWTAISDLTPVRIESLTRAIARKIAEP